MASFTLTSQTFASGTVTVYPASNWPATQLPPSGDPVGSSTTSATASGNSVTFTGLADDTKYYAHQDQSGIDRYVAFSTHSRVPPAQRSTDVVAPPFTLQSARYYGPPGGGVSNVQFVNGNGFRGQPFFVPENATFDRISCWVSTVGTGTTVLVRLGIYTVNTTALTGSLLLDAGTIDAATGTGIKEITISQTLSQGWYVLGGIVQGTSVTVGPILRGAATPAGVDVPGMPVISNLTTAAGFTTSASPSGALDSSATFTEVSNIPYVMLRKA